MFYYTIKYITVASFIVRLLIDIDSQKHIDNAINGSTRDGVLGSESRDNLSNGKNHTRPSSRTAAPPY